jgi:type IV pilus assembly protein PilY1
MRTLARIRFVSTVTAGVALAAAAGAQTEGPDVVAQQPNVMLLVDTSGSMEWKSSGDVDPVCDPLNPNTGTLTRNEKSRWIELVETLTGTIDNYSCYTEKRDTTTNFQTEFQLGPTDLPYDLGYAYDYHRPLSSLCAPGPGVLPPVNTPYVYPTGAIAFRPFQAGAIGLNSPACAFSQQRDGLLDAFDGLLRFGLMTFDTHPDPGTGVVSNSADNKNGMRGTWSYYLSAPSQCKRVGGSGECRSGATSDPVGCCVGTPANCNIPSAFEVGSRNAAAPPWEGRMVAFGPSAEDGTKRNQWIQEILLSTRPYGATPIAGMLDDARAFLWHDDTVDPLNAGQYFGPSKDPLVTATCRPNYVILLTDGAPNTDLRPSCENGMSSAMCPYDKSEDIANDLVTSTTNPQVRTFVVGFAISTVNPSATGGTPIDCQSMDLSLCSPTPTDPALEACCTLNNIAYNGTPIALRGKPPAAVGLPADDHALFPKNPTELRTALSRVFQTLLKQVTGRTFPITTSSSLNDKTGAAGYEFTSGARVLPTGLWGGVLNRQRITCDMNLNSTVLPVDPNSGDDFIANLTNDPTAPTRFISTVQPDDLGGGVRQATWSVRPYLEAAVNDGVGHYKGTQTPFDGPSSLASDIAPESMAMTASTAASTCGTGVLPSTCRTRLVEWWLGLPSAKPVSRCAVPGAPDCIIVGDIFHSVPQIRAGQPNEFVRDDAYPLYAASLAKRDTLLYTSSNDGFMHAFRVAPGDPADTDPNHAVKTKVNNEEWSFVPPAILPQVASMYPGTTTPTLNRIAALDGVPVIKDVSVTVGGPRALSTNYPYRFERKRAPDASQNESHSFRTIMVQAFGSKRGAYYALDITKPTIQTANLATTGPRFLWQLSTDAAGHQLFGKGSSTPLITTLFMNTGLSGQNAREVAVAVLPGGLGDASTGTCNTADQASAIPNVDGTVSSAYRSSMPCYSANGSSVNSIAARSLTIVKLDTGEIIRTFRPAGVTQPVTFPTGATTNLTDYTFDSNGTRRNLDITAPIVGQPVAYPATTGVPADRIFVGDAEGRLWRIDVSKPDPAAWSMNVFYDPYTALKPKGQPVQTPPVLSVDQNGQITVAFSTGDQDNLTPDATMSTYAVSLTEALVQTGSVTNFRGKLNWQQEFTGGKRVLGPMTLFDKTLYFSTFMQAVSASCNDLGTSSVWGLDYLLPAITSTPTSGGKQNLTTIDYPNVVVSGVGLRQRPSCSTAATVGAASTDDSFLGYGSLIGAQTSKVGAFELVIQKGGSKAGSGSANSASPTVATDTITPPQPKPPAMLSSWAPIIE